MYVGMFVLGIGWVGLERGVLELEYVFGIIDV